MCSKITALILARGSSKTIKNKNIIELNGIPLICYSLKAAVDSNVFDEIWVSTDDEIIAETIKKYHFKVKIFQRTSENSDDKSTSISAVNEFLQFKPELSVICLIQATSPCLHPCYLQQAKEQMIKNDYDSIFSVTRSHKLRWQFIDKKHLQPINFDHKNRPRRQDWPGELIESGHFYMAKTKIIREENIFQNINNIGYIEIPNELSMELDHQWQIPIMELLLKNHGYKF